MIIIVLGNLFLQKVSVELVAGLTDGQAAAILVEDFYLLVVEVVASVSQFACTLKISRTNICKWFVTEAYGWQAAVDHILTQGAQYLVVRVLPVLHGHHNVVVVNLGKAVEVER